jgi:hypothetical protein
VLQGGHAACVFIKRVEQPTDNQISRCFAIAAAARSIRSPAEMATSRNWPRRSTIPSSVGANDRKARHAASFRAGFRAPANEVGFPPCNRTRPYLPVDSNEPSSCTLKSWLAVEGNTFPRKTKSDKALHPTFQATNRTGSSPRRTAFGIVVRARECSKPSIGSW